MKNFGTPLNASVVDALKSGDINKLEDVLEAVENAANFCTSCTRNADDGGWGKLADNLKFVIDALTRS